MRGEDHSSASRSPFNRGLSSPIPAKATEMPQQIPYTQEYSFHMAVIACQVALTRNTRSSMFVEFCTVHSNKTSLIEFSFRNSSPQIREKHNNFK